MPILPVTDTCFIPFGKSADTRLLPRKFTFLLENRPHPLCLLAAEELQVHLTHQQVWQHNFGLGHEEEGAVIGKMFGVLVVETQQHEVGYLSAFSGKLAGGNHHAKFVPPVFDSLTDNSFLNTGMQELTRMNLEIKQLEISPSHSSKEQIRDLKNKRKNDSVSLQNKLFENYLFLNKAGQEKSLQAIFKEASYKNPPSGAGECAAPKLLQYAFRHHLKPLALAEFWWGRSPKSDHWKHKQFYACCKEKCAPIFVHMLHGIDQD